ncbi:MAG: sigma-70 family RNA polymerase sigma factor [Bacteroidetes bacterium]|nr:MAG: sigma-70 family RNA polymerase sigma factor [Bacteroidota bacterium]
MDPLFPVPLAALCEHFGQREDRLFVYLNRRSLKAFSDEDLLLLLRCQAAAFRELGIKAFKYQVQRLELKVFRSFRFDPSTEQDLCQEAYLGLHRHLINPDWSLHSASLSSYYYRILKNLAIQRAIQGKKESRFWSGEQSEEQKDHPTPAEDGILQQLIHQEEREAFRNAIEQLPPKKRDILLMRYYKNMDYEAIQIQLGHSTKYVSRNLVFSALKALKNKLKPD